jgi:catechol 2,3-dioxygenase-like lactoylglutathione lyase family enzyme
MGILELAKPVIVICTRDRARSTAFYRDTLGLIMTSEDNFASVFDVGGTAMRISTVADFTPHEHTILGFNVPDVAAVVRALREKGVVPRPGRKCLECNGRLIYLVSPGVDIKLRRHRKNESLREKLISVLEWGRPRGLCRSCPHTLAD